VVDGSAVDAEQGVMGDGCVVGAIRLSATRVATDTVCCRDHKEDLPLRIRAAHNTISLAKEASANRRVPMAVELFDPTPLRCCAYLINIETVASASWLWAVAQQTSCVRDSLHRS